MLGGPAESSVEEGLDAMARHARSVLVAIAGIELGGAALLWVAGGTEDVVALVPQIVVGVVFVGLAVWARRAPMVPVVIGVGLYALSVVGTLLVTPGALLSMWGLILHAILIVLCINGVASARSYDELARRFRTPPA